MARFRQITVTVGLAAAGVAAVALVRHRAASGGRDVCGGLVMDDAGSYDTISRVLLGSLFAGIARDVERQTTRGAEVLEVGCGPGHLALLLARDHALRVIGIDLDERMVERARANAVRGSDDPSNPRFELGDVAALPFDDASFDLVVSTMSLHHWEDPETGLAEIGRVLVPGGRALIWDLQQGGLPFHRHVPDPASHAVGSGLRLVDERPWRWPGPFSLSRRVEFVRDNNLR